MKKITLSAVVCLFLLFQSQAQSIDREVLAIAGNSNQNNNISMSWTLGELAISQYENNTIEVTEGFHQGEAGGVPIDDLLSVFGQIRVYPNPTTQRLQIEREVASKPLFLQLTDINGKALEKQSISDLKSTLDLSGLANGLYILRLSDGSKRFRTYRIQKR